MKHLKSTIILIIFLVFSGAVIFLYPRHESTQINHEEQTLEEKLFEVFKLDQNKTRFSLHHSKTAQSLQEWKNQLGGKIILNAGFFDEFNKPTGYTIIDGQVLNPNKYDLNSTGSVVIINSHIDIIDTQIETIPDIKNQTIFQTFPILISNGKANLSEDSQKFARRTILAEDYNQNLLIIIFDTQAVTLFNAMQILLESDLNIKTAINLDGGPSTGLITDEVLINSFGSLPLVLRVE